MSRFYDDEDEHDNSDDRAAAAAWAAEMLARPVGEVLILDTETTDLEGEIIDLAILDTAGWVRYSGRFRPKLPIATGAYALHGLTEAALAGEPTWAEQHDCLAAILAGPKHLLIYNSAFDVARYFATCRLHGCQPAALPEVECLMHVYAQWWGDWNDYYGSYRWQPLLGGGHTALSDCQAALALLQMMAAEHIPDNNVCRREAERLS